MIWDIHHNDFIRDILPFTQSGILIDTSVIKIIIEGLISVRLSKKGTSEEYTNLVKFFELIKANNRWDKFCITPHILTEVCGHIHKDYGKQHNYKQIISEVFPMLKDMGERTIEKDRILQSIDFNNPIIELGDLSLFLLTEDIITSSDKVAILVKDEDFNKRYEDNPRVLILDFNRIIWNMS